MNRSDLYEKLQEKFPYLSEEFVRIFVNSAFENISTSLEEGRRVELRGFGTFFVKKRKGRIGRNPKTGAAVFVAPKVVPLFRIGKGLLTQVNATKPLAFEDFRKKNTSWESRLTPGHL